MKLLLLVDDFVDAAALIKQLDLKNPKIIYEQEVAENTGLTYGDPYYISKLTNSMASLTNLFQPRVPAVIVMHLMHYKAVELIKHDISVLIYNGQKKQKLFYNVRYPTNFSLQTVLDHKTIAEINSQIQKISLK